MPKVPVDYSKTHFYKIVCKDLSIKDCYVGHTTNFNKRKHHHKHICNNLNNIQSHTYKFQFIRENGGWDNWEMVLINTETCQNSNDAVKKEREYIEQLQATLNKTRPIISREEGLEFHKKYYKDNIDKFKQHKKEHYNNNKEVYSEYAKNYYQEHKEKIKQRRMERYYNKD